MNCAPSFSSLMSDCTDSTVPLHFQFCSNAIAAMLPSGAMCVFTAVKREAQGDQRRHRRHPCTHSSNEETTVCTTDDLQPRISACSPQSGPGQLHPAGHQALRERHRASDAAGGAMRQGKGPMEAAGADARDNAAQHEADEALPWLIALLPQSVAYIPTRRQQRATMPAG